MTHEPIEGRRLPPGQSLRSTLKVQHYGRVPKANRDSWFMMFTAAAAGPHASAPALGGQPPRELGRLTASELDAMAHVDVVADLHCASGWSVLDNAWRGVPAAALVERFPPPPGTIGVLVYAEYGFCANVRLADLLHPSTLLATRLNGAQLAPEHGYPVRLVVPHLYAYKSVKWFRGWEYLRTARRGFWEERGYHLIGDPWTGERYSYQE